MTRSPLPMVPDPQVPARRFRWVRPTITLMVVVALLGALWWIGAKRLHAVAWNMGWREGGRFANPAISAYRSTTRIRAYVGPAQLPSWKGVPWQTCEPIIYYQNQAQILPPLRTAMGADLQGLRRQPHDSATANRKKGQTHAAPTMSTDYVIGNQFDILPVVFIGGGQQGSKAVTFQTQFVSPPRTIYENVGLTVGGRTSGRTAHALSRMLHMPLQHRIAMRLGGMAFTESVTMPVARFGVEYAQALVSPPINGMLSSTIIFCPPGIVNGSDRQP